jgi:hypothetical protein
MSQTLQEQTTEQEAQLLSGAILKVEAMKFMDDIKKYNKTGQLPAAASGSTEKQEEEIPAGQKSPEGMALPTKHTSKQASNQLSNPVRNQARQQSISLSMNPSKTYKNKTFHQQTPTMHRPYTADSGWRF